MALAHKTLAPATRRRLLAYPPATPVQLPPPVAMEDVVRGEDRFRCPKLHAVITASDCKKRHDAAHANTSGHSSSERMFVRQSANFTTPCRGCDVGPQLIHPKLVVKKNRRTT